MKRPLRHALSLLAGDAASRFLGFLITVYLARVLAPAAFGMISIGLAVLGHLTLIGSPGIQVLETRNVAATQGGLQERVGGVLLLRLTLAALLVFLTWAVTSLLLVSRETADIVVLYAGSMLPMAFLLDWFFVGKEQFGVVSVARTVNYLVFGAVTFLLVRGSVDVRSTPVAFLIGNAAAAAFLYILYTLQFGRPHLRWRPGLWWTITRQNLPVGGAMFLAQMVINLPPLVIGYFLTVNDVGMYSAAMKLVFLLLFIDRLLNAMFLPVVTRYMTTRREEVPTLLKVTLKVGLLLLLPLAVIVLAAAPAAVVLVFGPGYEDAALLLRTLVGYVVLTIFNSIFVCTVVASGRERAYSSIMIWGSLVLALLLSLLTWIFGVAGSAVAVVLGEGFVTIWMMVEAARVTRLPPLSIVVRPLASALAMLLVGFLLRNAHPALLLPVVLIVYGAAILASGGLAKDEFRYLRERFV